MTDTPFRVFVVEDEALISMEICDRLSGLGYVICGTAARGETALVQCPTARPDIVLMDVQLAGVLDGIETATLLRQSFPVPVVFLTAYSDDALIERAVGAGPAAFLVKPFEVRELHATLQAALYKHRWEQQLVAANSGLETEIRLRTAELTASESRLRQAQRIARTGDWVLDVDSGGVDWSDVLYSIFERDPAAYRPTLESFLTDIVHPDDRAALLAEQRAAILTGTQRNLDHRACLPDGRERWVHLEATAEYDEAGRPVRLRGIAQDITERKLAEFALHDVNATLEWRVDQRTRALAESERFSHGILDAISQQLAVLDAEGLIIATNKAWRGFAPLARSDAAALAEGGNYLEVCNGSRGDGEEDARLMAEGIRGVLAGRLESFAHEYPCDVFGDRCWFVARVAPFSPDGPPMVVVTHDDVTMVHEARERVAEGERVFASLALASPVGVYRTDAAGRCEYVNLQWCALTGLEEADALGDGWVRALHPDDLARVVQLWAAAVRSGAPFRDEYRFVQPDGRHVWVLDQAVTVPGPQGDVVGMIGTLTDITERKQVELAMRALSEDLVTLQGDEYVEAALRQLAALLDVEICFITRFDSLNADHLRTEVLLEDGARQPSRVCALAPTPCADVRPGTGGLWPQGVQQAYPDDPRLPSWAAESYAGEALVDHAGRMLGTVAVIGRHPFTDPAKISTILRLFAVALSAEIAQQRDRRRYEDLFEFAPSGLVISDRTGRIVMVNRRAEELFGWSAAELPGQPIEVLVPPGSRGAHAPMRESYQARPERRTMASGRRMLLGLRKDGTRFPAEIELAPVETEDGQMIAASVRDVSERDRVDDELETARRHLLDAIESTAQAMVLYDADDRVAVFNRQFVALYPGVEDVIRTGMPFEALIREAVARGLLTPPAGETVEDFVASRMSIHLHADGTPFIRRLVDGRTVSFADRRTHGGGVVTVGTDITEVLAQEQRVREMQKMDAMGKLTGGMAHDFNNYLGVIMGSLDLLRDDTTGRPEAEALVMSAREGAVRAAELTRSLLAFARRQPLDPRPTDLPPHLQSLGVLLSRSLGEDVRVRLDVDDDLWPVSIDVSQFDSSVVNLANNARDAMPGGGELRIGAQNVAIKAVQEGESVDIRPGSYVRIEVSDSGIGMSPDVIGRAFEPFFTTKPAGHGTGLGLSMVYGFVTQSGGALRVYSELGHGTVVRMFLPRVEAAAVEGEAGIEELPSVPARGHETILVVEDNEAIRRTVVAQLSSLGYRVLVAANGAAALLLLEEHADEIALVFTDVVMPGYPNGHELADLVETRYRGLRVLLTSGFPGDAWSRMGNGGERRHLLSKPYRMDALALTVRRVLDAAEPPHS